ncbi:MAG: type 1 glutamine amidotransferase [Paracoccaceae bacterium]
MKIGILQAGHTPDDLVRTLGDYDSLYPDLLAGYGFSFEAYCVVDMEFPKSIAECDGWLISGSRYGAYEDHTWIPLLEDFIRQIYADGRPLVGVCFGHQIIAQALGGKVEKYKGGWSVGHTEYIFDGEIIPLNAWHQDQVTKRPTDAKVIASTDFCENAAFVYGDKVWSLQPHPEFSAAFVDGLINGRGQGVVPEPILAEATAKLTEPLANAAIADRMAAFFRQERL